MPRTPTCHPERPHLAKGLCSPCYRTAQRRRRIDAETPEERAARPEKERVYFRGYRKRWREENPERERENQRRYYRAARAKDPDGHRLRVGAALYGISVDEYRALRERCDVEPCEVCGSPGPLQIDHCHETGAIRGLLCGNCNSALGHAKDDVERLRALIRYLT